MAFQKRMTNNLFKNIKIIDNILEQKNKNIFREIFRSFSEIAIKMILSSRS